MNPEQVAPQQQPSTDLISFDQFKESQLKKFQYDEETLRKKAEEYDKLEIVDVKDKEGLEKVRMARIELKKDRVGIEKTGKSLRDLTNSYNKAILERENALVGIIEPTEEKLKEKEVRILQEVERLRQEDEKRESDRIQAMIDNLNKVGAAMDFHALKGLTDEQFEAILADATKAHEQKIAQEEQERIQRQQEEERQAKAREEESKRNAAEKKRLEEIQAEQDRKAEELRKQQEQLEEEKRKILEERTQRRIEKLESLGMKHMPTYGKMVWHSKDYEEETTATISDFVNLLEVDFANLCSLKKEQIAELQQNELWREAEKQKAEVARIKKEQEEAVAKALQEKDEKDRQEKAAELERLAEATDYSKFQYISEAISKLTATIGAMNSDKGKDFGALVIGSLAKANAYCKEFMTEDRKEIL